MKTRTRRILLSLSLIVVLLFSISTPIYSHPGNTNSSGCHVCYTNCSSWGYITGTSHCHSGSSNNSNSNSGGSFGFVSSGDDESDFWNGFFFCGFVVFLGIYIFDKIIKNEKR